MCTQCLVNPLYFGEVLPGWYLIRARRKGGYMEVGDWGLIRANDPDIIFKTTPMIEPNIGSEERIEYRNRVDAFYNELVAPVHISFRLVESAQKQAYNIEEDGHFHIWFFDHLAGYINKTTPETEEDPFPCLDETEPHDYTIGKN
jgi:hypothetical protein